MVTIITNVWAYPIHFLLIRLKRTRTNEFEVMLHHIYSYDFRKDTSPLYRDIIMSYFNV